MSILNEVLAVRRNIRDTLTSLASGDFSEAAKSYGKTIPVATLVAGLGKPLGMKVATLASSHILQPGIAKPIAAMITKGAAGAASAAKWWLAPAKVTGTKVVPTVGKAIASKASLAILKPIAVAGALTAADHGLSRLVKSPSGFDIVQAIVRGELTAKQKQLAHEKIKVHDILLGTHVRRGILRLVDRKDRRSKEEN